MSAALEAHGVRKEYGSLVALDDLSFAVEAGEILGVLGPNGAGKTTAIRVLTTILSPTRGSFHVAGAPHTRPAEIRTCIGVLPESAGYPEHQTGEEFLRFYARLYGHSRASAAAVTTALLAEVGLTERARSLVSTYSRGMRQRLGIAREHYIGPIVVNGHGWSDDASFLLAPLVAAIVFAAAVPVLSSRFLRLGGGWAK